MTPFASIWGKIVSFFKGGQNYDRGIDGDFDFPWVFIGLVICVIYAISIYLKKVSITEKNKKYSNEEYSSKPRDNFSSNQIINERNLLCPKCGKQVKDDMEEDEYFCWECGWSWK